MLLVQYNTRQDDWKAHVLLSRKYRTREEQTGILGGGAALESVILESGAWGYLEAGRIFEGINALEKAETKMGGHYEHPKA